MTRSERLLAILEFLRGRTQPVTAAQLATQFHVSERSIYRDISILNHQGARIEGSAGFGYIFRGGYFLPPLAFDPDETAAILLGLRFVLRRGDAELIRAAESARAKIAAQAPDQLNASVERNVPLFVGPTTSAADPDLLLAIRGAIAKERVLKFSYRDNAGQVTRRQVWPVALGWFEGAEVLAAWCELRDAFRSFRIDRIGALAVLDETIPTPRAFLLAEYLKLEPQIQF